MDDVVNILNKTKTLDLLYKINKFKQITPKLASNVDFVKYIRDALPFFLVNHKTLDNEYYRIRRNQKDCTFSSFDDFWYPKPSQTKIGRLNRNGEPIFYLCSEPVTCFHEARIRVGDYFTLMFYTNKAEMKITALVLEGVSIKEKDALLQHGLTELGLTNYLIMCDFIRTELIREVSDGTEYLYNITNSIKEYFDQNNSETSFVYTSVNNYECNNIAIKTEVVNSFLKCTGCLFGVVLGYTENGESVSVKPLARISNEISSDKIIEHEYFEGEGSIQINMKR